MANQLPVVQENSQSNHITLRRRKDLKTHQKQPETQNHLFYLAILVTGNFGWWKRDPFTETNKYSVVVCEVAWKLFPENKMNIINQVHTNNLSSSLLTGARFLLNLSNLSSKWWENRSASAFFSREETLAEVRGWSFKKNISTCAPAGENPFSQLRHLKRWSKKSKNRPEI